MWEFGFVGSTNNFSGSGAFTLGGPGTSDGLVAFEFDGICGQNELGEDNICMFGLGASWTLAQWILSPDDSTLELAIVAMAMFSDFSSGIEISGRTENDLIFLALNCDTGGGDGNEGTACNGDSTASRIGQTPFTAFLQPVAGEVPEPPTLALFLVALGGLGFMARRRVA